MIHTALPPCISFEVQKSQQAIDGVDCSDGCLRTRLEQLEGMSWPDSAAATPHRDERGTGQEAH